jgi:hypothetical protein
VSHAGSAHQRVHEGRRAKLAALAVTVGLHFFFVAGLLRVTHASLDGVTQDQDAIQVIFISRPSSVLHQVPSTQAVAPRQRTAALRQSPDLERQPKAISPMDDQPNVASTIPPTRLDFSIVPAEIDFRRNPIERPALVMEATPSRLQVRMLDRSFGGRLNAMTQRRACGELRAALATHSESTASIMQAMQRRGCAI